MTLEERREKNRLRAAAWRAAHPGAQNDYLKAYHAAHRDEQLAKRRTHYAAHREELLAVKRAAYVPHQKPQAKSLEEKIAQKRAYRAAHLEAGRVRDKAYREANRQKVQTLTKAWKLANREKWYAGAERWAKKNQAALRAFAANRRARVASVFVETVDPRTVFERDKGVCKICRKSVYMTSHWEIDHVIPISKGGAHAYDNVQLAHRRCNRAKSASLPVGQPTLFHVAAI